MHVACSVMIIIHYLVKLQDFDSADWMSLVVALVVVLKI